MKTVLIVASDLGFTLWLGRVLENGCYVALPAKSVGDAVHLIDQFKLEIDVLIVNHALPGVDPFIEHLRRSQHSKVIALTDDPDDLIPPGVCATKNKPLRVDEHTGIEWLGFVEAVLSNGPQSRSIGFSVHC
jgi:hypothetical protein